METKYCIINPGSPLKSYKHIPDISDLISRLNDTATIKDSLPLGVTKGAIQKNLWLLPVWSEPTKGGKFVEVYGYFQDKIYPEIWEWKPIGKLQWLLKHDIPAIRVSSDCPYLKDFFHLNMQELYIPCGAVNVELRGWHGVETWPDGSTVEGDLLTSAPRRSVDSQENEKSEEKPEETPMFEYYEWIDKYAKDLRGTLKAIDKERRALNKDITTKIIKSPAEYDKYSTQATGLAIEQDIAYGLFIPIGYIESAIRELCNLKGKGRSKRTLLTDDPILV